MIPEEQQAYNKALHLIEQCRKKGKRGKSLDLIGLGLTTLPPEIGQLSALTVLDLSNNQLTTLPQEIGRLSALKDLILWNNQISRLPAQIGQLSALTALDLWQNQLSSLPPQISQLSALTELSLAANQLTTLPPEIGQLPALTLLNLSNNHLTTLPPEIGLLVRLTQLYLHGNSGLELPAEVLGPAWEDVFDKKNKPSSPRAVLDFYFSRQAGGTKPLNEVKVILVGRGGAGKTSIRKRLIENRFDPEQKETLGIEIDHWPLEGSADGIEAHLWDFAGQDITHATHQFFLTKRSLYLLVLDGRSDSQDRDAEYWLRLIRAFGEDSPALVLLNKWDAKPFPLQEFTLRREFPQIRGFIRTDCRTGLGIRELEKTLLTTVRKMESVTQPFPTLWFNVKERLADMRENYLPLCDYRRLCQREGVSDPGKQDSLAETLHTLGIILHYPDDPRLHDTTVLNPRWVTASVYALLRHVEKRQAVSQTFDGHLTLAEARASRPAERPQKNADGTPLDMVAYLLGLMERFELCYPLEGEEQTWLIPQLLSPQNPPDLGEAWFTEPATRLRYQYTVLPEGLLPRFIVRAHPLALRGQVWRQGVVLEMEDETSGGNARALVIAEPGRERIEVTVIGPSAARLRLTKLVRAHFHDIHASFSQTRQRDGESVQINSLDARELVELEGQPGQFQSVKTLLVDERENNISTIATDEKGSVRIDQSQELDRVAAPEGKERQPAERELKRQRPKVFLSYAHANAAYRDVFLQNLEVMESDGLIDSWYDGKVLASQDFDKEIRRAMHESDLIIFLISTASLRSKYIREVELGYAVEAAKRMTPAPKIIPILLEQDCAWKEGKLAHFQTLPGDRNGNIKPVDQWPNRRQAFNAVEQALRKLLKNG
jgi:internalin A